MLHFVSIKINASQLKEFSHVSGYESHGSSTEEFMLPSDELDDSPLNAIEEIKTANKNPLDLAEKLRELLGNEKKIRILRELQSEVNEMRFMYKFLSLVILCLDENEDKALLQSIVNLWIFVENM